MLIVPEIPAGMLCVKKARDKGDLGGSLSVSWLAGWLVILPDFIYNMWRFKRLLHMMYVKHLLMQQQRLLRRLCTGV